MFTINNEKHSIMHAARLGFTFGIGTVHFVGVHADRQVVQRVCLLLQMNNCGCELMGIWNIARYNADIVDTPV